jgi:hypothetical protein
MGHDNKRLITLLDLNTILKKPGTDSLLFFSFSLMLTITQMTSHGSSKGGERTFPHGRTCTRGFSPYLVGGTSGSRLYDASPLHGAAVREASGAPL